MDSMSNDTSVISARLREAFDSAFPSSSLAEVSRQLHVTPNTLNNYLQHDRLPSCDFLITLAKVGVDIHWLLTGEGTTIAEENSSRLIRVQSVLAVFSDSALMAEVDRRLHEAIRNGIGALEAVGGSELGHIARKLRNGTSIADLLEEELELVNLVNNAFWSFDRVMWWYPDLDPSLKQKFHEFLEMHAKITNDKSVRVIQYAYSEHRILTRSTP